MPKALVPLAGEPVVVHALRSALGSAEITDVVVVAPPDPDGLRQLTAALHLASPDLPSPDARAHDLPSPDRGHVLHRPGTRPAPTGDTSCTDRGHAVSGPGTRPAPLVVPGGAERSDSVALGLAALPAEVGLVLVHDAARALTPPEVFDRVVGALRSGHAAVTPALPVVDTVKQVQVDPSGGETVVGTVDRSTLRAVQTPQGFLRETLERAHAEVEHAVTDDAGMVEALGGQVHVVPGSPRAMKITTPHDLEVAAAWLADEGPTGARTGAATSADVAPTKAARDDAMPVPVLVVLSGLPGVGKTGIARELARLLPAAHLRVDTVEQALVRSGLPEAELGPHGYAATYALAADQLAAGLGVVADMVNGVEVTRQAWDEVGSAAGAQVVRVLVECSDPAEHRRRVEEREPDIAGHQLPTWADVAARPFTPWPEADLRVDTAGELPHTLARRIAAHVRERRASMCRNDVTHRSSGRPS